MKLVILLLIVIPCVAGRVLKGCKKPSLTGGEINQSKAPRSGVYEEGTYIGAKCNEGWYRTGSAHRTCRADGSWSGKIFSCQKKLTNCSDPGTPLGARRSGKCCKERNALRYFCNNGLFLSGNSKIVCQSNGRWSKPTPSCHRDPRRSCPDPGFIANSSRHENKLVAFKDFGPDDVITFTCDRGYAYDPFGLQFYEMTHTITCLGNGMWDNDFITCEEVKCPYPEVPYNGWIFPQNRTDFRVDEVATVRCNEGYEIKGDFATCDAEGFWDKGAPSCEVIKCPDPSWPEHGRRVGNDFRIGQTVTFVCETGYTMRGSESRTCQSSRTWNGTLTICDKGDSDCPDPGRPIGAIKDGQSYTVGDVVTFTCGEDFLLQGSESRKCLQNGRWSGLNTYCKHKNSFSNVEEVANIFKEKMDTISIGSKDSFLGSQIMPNITYDVNETLGRSLHLNHQFGLDLYIALDISGSISDEELDIAKNFTKALVEKVGVSDEIDGTRVAIITYHDEVDEISGMFEPERTVDKVKAKIDKIQRIGSRGTATAKALEFVQLVLIPTRKVTDSKAKIALILLTDGKHNMGGDPKPIAEGLKSDYLVDMYTIGLGDDIDQDVLSAIASEDQFFHLQKTTDLKTLTEKLIDDSVDSYSECGVGGLINAPQNQNITEDNEAEDIKHWPWMVALHYDENKIGKRSSYAFRCGASLIDAEWVLTAAHCVYKERENEERMDVRMGSLERQDKRKTISDVEEIIIHPDYDPVTLNNDVALLQLSVPVIFTTTIRKVCLPDDIRKYPDIEDDIEFYSPKTWTTVTGWGHDQKVKGDDKINIDFAETLKQIQMQIQDNSTCIGSLSRKQKYTDAMYCAGDGGKRDTCKGDSGGPSMVQMKVNELNTERVFQVGVVSWGDGCFQENKYGFYTKLTEFVPWIRKIIDGDKIIDEDI